MTSGGDWVEQARRLMESLRLPGTAGDDDNGGTGCRWCPHCQAAAIARGERPELTAAVADILAVTSTALRQFAGETVAPDQSPAPEEPSPATQPAQPAVQRIELS